VRTARGIRVSQWNDLSQFTLQKDTAVAEKLLMVLVLLPAMLVAQNGGKIAGIVTDESNQPIPGINIVIEGTTLGASSGTDGRYFIINISPDSYSMRVSGVGYAPKRVTNVKVMEGMTTRVDVQLSSTDVLMQEVVVEHERPAVQKDLTSKMQGFDASDIQRLPVQSSLQDLIVRQAGISADIMTTPISSQPVFGQFATIPNDGLHFRGGRTNETLYLFDGINVGDGLWGGFDLGGIGQFTLSSIQTVLGTFGPQYGEAMSGVLEMQTPDNPASTVVAHAVASTDRFGKASGSQHTLNYEAQLSVPVPLVSNVSLVGSARRYSSDGYLFGYIYPDYVDSRGSNKSGSPRVIPLSYTDTDMLFGKVIWQIGENAKLRGGVFTTKSLQGIYNHYFKYNPFGTPHRHLSDLLIYGKYTQLLTQSTFIDVSISQYLRKFKSHVYDSAAEYAVIPQNGTAEFSISGEDWVYFDSFFKRVELQARLTSQITSEHLITTGVTFDRMETGLQRLNPDGFFALEDYDLTPKKFGAFINDKMEFEEMGLVLNIGGRFDYIDPDRQFVLDITRPDGTVGKVKARRYFSPRFGISYPISDVAAFRFGWGHYYQYPDFFKAFQGMNRQFSLYPQPDVAAVQGAVAVGDIQEERTVNYEVGVQLKLSPTLSADFTGFYRKMSNLIGLQIVDGYLTSGSVSKLQRFPAFANVSDGTVKGVELSFTSRFSKGFSGFFNYTYSKSMVTSSVLFSLPTDMSKTFPADWDQTHTASFGVMFDFNGEWGFSLIGSASSGLPYTYSLFQPNAERSPWISSLDFMAFKDIVMSPIRTRLFLQIFNLPNRKNVWWVYPDSGRPGVSTNTAYSSDYTNNPSMWGPGRRIQAGLSVSL